MRPKEHMARQVASIRPSIASSTSSQKPSCVAGGNIAIIVGTTAVAMEEQLVLARTPIVLEWVHA